MKVEFDFSELERFARRLDDTYPLNSALMTATQNVARALHKRLITQTPVDTGNLRKMWSAGDNLLFTVEEVADGFQVTFVNSARADSKDGYMYGVAVNDGHRHQGGGWVMGRFFVERSIIQTAESAQLEEIIMTELRKWWKEL